MSETSPAPERPVARDRQETSEGASEAKGKRWLLSGAGLVLAPLLLLALPLFFHRSPQPFVGPYGRGYALGLLGLLVLAISASATVGWLCRRRSNLLPAQFCLLIIGSTVFALGLAEVVLRNSDRANDAFRGFRLVGHKKSVISGFETTPNLSYVYDGIHYTTDASGFRLHGSDPNWRESDAPRIFAVGASSTFGMPVEDDQTWPHVLEGELRRRLPEQAPAYAVINAANPGHNTLQILLRVYTKVLPYQPRMVVFYEGRNDVRTMRAEPTDTLITEDILFSGSLTDYLRRDRAGQNWYLTTLVNRSIEWTVSRIRTGQPLMLQPPPVPVADPVLRREIMVANAGLYLRNLTALSDLCRREGVALVLVTFLDDPAIAGDYVAEAIDHENDLLRGLAKREGLALIDLAREFEGVEDKRPYFVGDGYHPTPLGARYIGERVGEELADLLRAR